MQARIKVRLAQAWGGHCIMSLREEIYWRCIGASTPMRLHAGGEIRQAFTSDEELQAQVFNVR